MHLKTFLPKIQVKKYKESLCHSLQMNHFLRCRINKNKFKTPNYSKYYLKLKNTQNMTKKEPKIENIMTKHHKNDFKTNSGFF